MPEYLTPGVYIEEFEIGARPIEGVGTSTAGFLGYAERGPSTAPKLVTSVSQYNRIFGGYTEDSFLAYAIDGFFRNGGQRCFVGRLVRTGAGAAALDVGPVRFTAVGEGTWGRRAGIRIEKDRAEVVPAGGQPKKFKLTVAYWGKNEPADDELNVSGATEREQAGRMRELLARADEVEVFDSLSSVPDDPDYYVKKLGDPVDGLSNLVCLSSNGDGRPDDTSADRYFVYLTGGHDAAGDPGTLPLPQVDDFKGGTDSQGHKRGLAAFADVDEIAILYAPDAVRASEDQRSLIYDEILSHCETLKDRFAILDTVEDLPDATTITIDKVAGRSSKYAAIYYPWIQVLNPLTDMLRFIPPGGHVAGIYARSDVERGVHKAPANEVVRGTSKLKFTLSKGEQGILNPRGINVIRAFPGRGIVVWGARTAIVDPLWKYVNVRRLFIYVEESIEEGTQWVVFEPNNEKLWGRVRATITEFLTKVWTDGALMGTKPEEAFFVRCDRTTMTQDDIDNGRLICIIGIAPVKPAEFVIFRIAQWASGSKVTE